MRLICTFALAMLAATAAHAGGTNTRYLELTNRAHDSMTSFAIAAPGSDAFVDVPLGTPLHGGGDSTTLQVADASCRYDLRFTFADGRAMVYRGIDICRYPRVRVRGLQPKGSEKSYVETTVPGSSPA